MITIFHGEHTPSSYEAVQKEKEKYKGKEQITLNGDSLTRADLEVALTGNTLFSEEKIIIIEGLLSARPSKRKDEAIEYISKEEETAILLYDDKEVSAVQLKKFPKVKATNFKPPQSIFTFVDGISKENKKNTILKFHELIKGEPPEIVYTMIVRQFRNLMLVKEANPKYLGGLQPWMMSKYRLQANQFTLNELLILYRKLLDIDYKIKSGLTPLSLSELLDIFLIQL